MWNYGDGGNVGGGERGGGIHDKYKFVRHNRTQPLYGFFLPPTISSYELSARSASIHMACFLTPWVSYELTARSAFINMACFVTPWVCDD